MFSKRSIICTILVGLLLTSILLNGGLFYIAKKSYAKSKLVVAFPNTTFYQSANAALQAKQHQRVILFGDSRIQQWKNLPELEGFEFINRGIGGETTAQLRMRFKPDVLVLKPDVVILQLGINDLVVLGVAPNHATATIQQCQDNLKVLVEKLTKQAVEVILLTIIPPAKPNLARMLAWSERIGQSVVEINQYWLNLPKMARLHVIDTAKVLKNAQRQWHDNVNKDILHLTPVGYQYLNQAITITLNTL